MVSIVYLRHSDIYQHYSEFLAFSSRAKARAWLKKHGMEYDRKSETWSAGDMDDLTVAAICDTAMDAQMGSGAYYTHAVDSANDWAASGVGRCCPHCGGGYVDTRWTFCPYCGRRLQ